MRRLMKEEPDIRAITKEASLLVTKAAELFLEALTAQALACKAGSENSLTYADVGARPHSVCCFECALTRAPQRRRCPRRSAWTFCETLYHPRCLRRWCWKVVLATDVVCRLRLLLRKDLQAGIAPLRTRSCHAGGTVALRCWWRLPRAHTNVSSPACLTRSGELRLAARSSWFSASARGADMPSHAWCLLAAMVVFINARRICAASPQLSCCHTAW